MITERNNYGWQITGEKKLLDTVVMTLTEQQTLSPEGNPGKYIVMNANDWVVVIPTISKNGKEYFIMVEQWRHASKEMCIEFPGGVIDSGEEPEIAGKRELLEETGYKAEKLVHLASMSPNPALFSNTIHFYTATSLENTNKQHLDDDEFITIKKIPVEEVFSSMGSGFYSHGLMCAALFSYKQYLDKN